MNKIDSSLTSSIFSMDNNYDIEVSVLFNNKGISEIKNNNKLTILSIFPFINLAICKMNIKHIVDLSQDNNVLYISKVAKVSTMMNVAKRISNWDNIRTGKHDFSCVVIDTGVDVGVDLSVPNIKLIKFVDFINNKNYPYDDNGHGTMVCNVIAGSGFLSNGKIKGVDSETKLIVLKALDENGEGTANSILKAMQWIIDNKVKYNIRVVCMSFGSLPQEKNDPLVLGAEVLWDNGITVVVACGNAGPKEKSIMSPAISKKIITVGAIDDGRSDGYIHIPDFSSRGPSNNTHKPDVVASGVNVLSGSSYHIYKKSYKTMSGTSVSTPIVAGIVSRLISNNNNLTPIQIKDILLNNCISINGNIDEEGKGYISFK